MTQSNVAELAIDITAERCPMTYVRTRLALDRLASGQILAVTLRGEEPASNVPRTAVEQGHAIVRRDIAANGDIVLFIRKG